MKYRPTHKGQAFVLIAILFVGLLGAGALALDGGSAFAERRRAQNAADAAALAGALAKIEGQAVAGAALSRAASNGYINDGATNSVEVSNPHSEGPYTGNSEYVQVAITSSVQTLLAGFLGWNELANTVTAVAHAKPGTYGPVFEGYAIVALDPSANETFRTAGNGSIISHGGGFFVNSDHSHALNLAGNGDIVAMSPAAVDIVGNFQKAGNGSISPEPNTGVAYQSDPLEDLPAPDEPEPAGAPSPTPDGWQDQPGDCPRLNYSQNPDIILNPGCYSELRVTGNGSITLNPGLYYIKRDEFAVTGNGGLRGAGVLIYMGPDASRFTLTDNGDVNLRAMTSGPYSGMYLYVDRENSTPNGVHISGNGVLLTEGTAYAPSTQVTVTGNGGNDVLYGQIIANEVETTGNGDLDVTYDSSEIFHLAEPPKVSLAQ